VTLPLPTPGGSPLSPQLTLVANACQAQWNAQAAADAASAYKAAGISSSLYRAYFNTHYLQSVYGIQVSLVPVATPLADSYAPILPSVYAISLTAPGQTSVTPGTLVELYCQVTMIQAPGVQVGLAVNEQVFLGGTGADLFVAAASGTLIPVNETTTFTLVAPDRTSASLTVTVT